MLTTIGAGETISQTGEARLVVDCSVKLMALVGQIKRTVSPAGMIVNCETGSEMLNTVPLPEVPPAAVVPYKVFPNKTRSAWGLAPSLLVAAVPETALKL